MNNKQETQMNEIKQSDISNLLSRPEFEQYGPLCETKSIKEFKLLCENVAAESKINQLTEKAKTGKIIDGIVGTKEFDFYLCGRKAFFRDDKGWKNVEVQESQLKLVLERMCLAFSTIGLSQTAIRYILCKFLELHTFSKAPHNVIQFDDFYLKGKELEHSVYAKPVPRFYVDGLTFEDVKHAEVLPKEMHEFCMALVNQQADAYEAFLDILAYSFITDQKVKASNMCLTWIDDSKTKNEYQFILAKVMKAVLGEQNIAELFLQVRKDDLTTSENSLLTISAHLSEKANETVTASVLASSCEAYLYEHENIKHSPNFIFFDEKAPIAVDKMNKMMKLFIFRPEETLQNIDEQFAKMLNAASVRQTRAYLVARAHEMMESCQQGNLFRHEYKMPYLASLQSQNNIYAFLEEEYDNEYGKLELKQVAELYFEYVKYCRKNNMLEQSTRKFSLFLEEKSQLKRKVCNVNATLRKRDVMRIQVGDHPEKYIELDVTKPKRTSRFYVRKC